MQRWVALVVKNPPANAGDIREAGLIPGLRRSPGGGHGNPSCLENPTDRGAWWAMVHSVTKSRAQLKQLSTHAVIDSQGCAFPEQRTTGLRAEWHPASPQALHLHTLECVVQGNNTSCGLLLREFENPWLALRGATGTEQVARKSTSKPGLHARAAGGKECALQPGAGPRGRGQCTEVSVDYSPAQTRGAEVSAGRWVWTTVQRRPKGQRSVEKGFLEQCVWGEALCWSRMGSGWELAGPQEWKARERT